MQTPMQRAMADIKAEPIYSDGRVALYHADCRDILARVAPGKDTTVISDPPYGIKWSHSGSRVNRPIMGDDKPFDPAHLLRFRCVLFGATHYCQRLPPGGAWQIWDKRCPASDPAKPRTCRCGPCNCNDIGDFEDIWCSFRAHRTIYRHMWNGFCKASEKGVARIHPTQKPVLLMGWLIYAHTRPGDLVIDPYAGSCSTLIAAHLAGRYAIGIEADGAHIAPAIARLKKAAEKPA